MSATGLSHDARVAVLVDRDNVPTDIVEHALRMVAQFGRVVLRRGYGNHATLDGRTSVSPWISIPATSVSGAFTGGDPRRWECRHLTKARAPAMPILDRHLTPSRHPWTSESQLCGAY
jgi:hypothetical protein